MFHMTFWRKRRWQCQGKRTNNGMKLNWRPGNIFWRRRRRGRRTSRGIEVSPVPGEGQRAGFHSSKGRTEGGEEMGKRSESLPYQILNIKYWRGEVFCWKRWLNAYFSLLKYSVVYPFIIWRMSVFPLSSISTYHKQYKGWVTVRVSLKSKVHFCDPAT